MYPASGIRYSTQKNKPKIKKSEGTKRVKTPNSRGAAESSSLAIPGETHLVGFPYDNMACVVDVLAKILAG